jgi:hypothetical protein
MDERRAELDLAESFARAGRTWVELDDEGRVVERDGRAGSRATKKPAADGPTAKEPPAAKRSANNRQRAPKKPASALVAEAIGLADGSTVYDNSSALSALPGRGALRARGCHARRVLAPLDTEGAAGRRLNP